jgi:hypothetical protein
MSKAIGVIYWELVGLASHYENKAIKLRDNGLDDEADEMDTLSNEITNAYLSLDNIMHILENSMKGE